jgi:hypothetical protein
MDCWTAGMPDAEPRLLSSHRGPPFCVELHYIIHPYSTSIKQQGQGRDSTFSLGLNPPSSSMNRKTSPFCNIQRCLKVMCPKMH